MRKRTKFVCFAIMAMAVLFVVSLVAQPVARGGFVGDRPAGGEDSGELDGGAYYGAGGGVAPLCYALAESSGEARRAPSEIPSDIRRRMYRDAAVVSRSEPRIILKIYITEHCRSITEGGKNSIISSANLFKVWRDAMRPVSYS